jgi:hypothetical protein
VFNLGLQYSHKHYDYLNLMILNDILGLFTSPPLSPQLLQGTAAITEYNSNHKSWNYASSYSLMLFTELLSAEKKFLLFIIYIYAPHTSNLEQLLVLLRALNLQFTVLSISHI